MLTCSSTESVAERGGEEAAENAARLEYRDDVALKIGKIGSASVVVVEVLDEARQSDGATDEACSEQSCQDSLRGRGRSMTDRDHNRRETLQRARRERRVRCEGWQSLAVVARTLARARASGTWRTASAWRVKLATGEGGGEGGCGRESRERGNAGSFSQARIEPKIAAESDAWCGVLAGPECCAQRSSRVRGRRRRRLIVRRIRGRGGGVAKPRPRPVRARSAPPTLARSSWGYRAQTSRWMGRAWLQLQSVSRAGGPCRAMTQTNSPKISAEARTPTTWVIGRHAGDRFKPVGSF